MKYLFCSLASHGFVYPAIGIAQALRRRGHEVAFITGPAFGPTLQQAGLARIPRGENDGESFQAPMWGNTLSIAMQIKHLEYALDRFAPDVLVGQQLTMGPLVIRERHRLPIALIGLAAYLLPTFSLDHEVCSEADRRTFWRYKEMLEIYNHARTLFRLPVSDATYQDTPLLGDLFLLQSVPALETEADALPPCVHMVGACQWEPPDDTDGALARWIADSIAAGRPVLYVHHGRYFDFPPFWEHLVEALKDQPVSVVAAVGRMDQAPSEPPANFFVRPHVPQGQVLPFAQAVVASSNTTAVLGAITHGLPSLLIPGGGEQPDIAERCRRAGVAFYLSPYLVSATELREAVRELLDNHPIRQNTAALRDTFAQINGFEQSADLLELLAATGQPVLREEVQIV